MESAKIFTTINRINSLVFLLLLLAGVGIVLTSLFSSNSRQQDRTVVVEDTGNETENRIELVLGNLHEIFGHNNHYVELSSRSSDGKFSGYSGGNIHNVLFFTGDKLNSQWLYKEHKNLIEQIDLLNSHQNGYDNKTTQAIYIRVIRHDSNNNGELDSNDNNTLALTRPDGTDYTEIITDIEALIDRDTSNNARELLILYQSKGQVILKKFSLVTFKLLSERVITEISRAP